MTAIYTKTLEGAGMWSAVVSRGKSLRLTALEPGANVGMLLYNAHNLSERYNMPDTLKGQHIFRLAAPFCVHSDMGRIFCGITEDTLGWHDTVCGTSNAAVVSEKYGNRTFQAARNDFHRNGRDCFLIELGKWGLGRRDLVPNINWFSKLVTDDTGALTFVDGHCRQGDHVMLRVEMDTLFVLHTLQHPLDPDPEYHPRRVLLEIFNSVPAAQDDACRNSRPENVRAYENTEAFNLLRFP